MSEVRRKTARLARLACVAAALGALGACADPEDQFKAGRLVDACDQTWPVCSTAAGCVLTEHSYLEGRMPGTRRFMVRTERAAKVNVLVYLKTEQATGDETRLEYNEAGCGSKSVESVTGKEFFREFDGTGEFTREKQFYQGGDHLIEFTSDATAQYLLKVEITEQQ